MPLPSTTSVDVSRPRSSPVERGSASPVEVHVGLIGLGTVGSAFVEAITKRSPDLERRFGIRLGLRQVAVARPELLRPRAAAGMRPHGDPARLAVDPTLDVVVEATGALEAAAWLRVAHRRGAAIVTANKQALVSDRFLLEALARHDPRLLCEAAAGAAVPVVRALRESLAADLVLSLRGVLNGTTTYVLSRLEAGRGLAESVAEAQCAGYAESDPSRDLEGQDAAAKLAILSTLAWRSPVGLERIATSGLGAETERLVRDARAAGRRVRLVARAEPDRDGRVVGSVSPETLGPEDPLAASEGVEAVVEVESALAGRLVWRGQGAGGRATASALLADVTAAARAIALARTGPREAQS